MPDSEKYFTVLQDGQLAVATTAQTGDIIPEESKDPERYFTALVQTDNGKQLCVKTFNLGGGGGGGGGVAPTVDTYTDNTGTTLATGETLSDFDTVLIYKNGVLLTNGASADYTISGNNIVFTTALISSDIITLIGLGGFAPTSTVAWGNVTGTLSNQTDLQSALNSKQGATNVVTLTASSTELASNTIYNGGELASVTLTLPATVPADFIAQVEFTSGTTPTLFTAPAALYFNGDRCEAGTFTPIASHRYCIMIISDGANTLGFCYER